MLRVVAFLFLILCEHPTLTRSATNDGCGPPRTGGHAATQACGDCTSATPDNRGRKPCRRSRNYTPWNRGWKPTTFSRGRMSQGAETAGWLKMGTGGLLLRRLRAKGSDIPTNFGWVNRGKLAASGIPSSRDQVEWLARHGVNTFLTLTSDPPTPEGVEGVFITGRNVPTEDDA